MVWFAAGIGVTPFIGMAKDIREGQNVFLYYCVRTRDEMIVLEELERIGKGFKVIPWCSTEKGRISLKGIKHIERGTKVYICGPGGYKEYLMDQLMGSGISREDIYDEDFDLK